MNKKTIKSEKTKKKLCDTFIKIYSQKNIENITIGEITNKAGVNRGTFYIYYEDIYDMINQIRNSLIEQIEKTILDIQLTIKIVEIKTFSSILIDFYIKNEKYLQPLLMKDSQFLNSLKQRVFPIAMQTLNINDNSSNSYTTYLVEYHISGTIAILNKWVSSGKEIKQQDLFELLFAVTTTGFVNALQN